MHHWLPDETRVRGAPCPLPFLLPASSSHEPPLHTEEAAGAELTRREVSLRWLGASILTGLTGAGLLWAAIYVSLEGEATFADVAERVVAPSVRTGAADEGTSNATRKGDKLVRSEMIASAKQSFRAPITLRTGDREVIRLRSFVRVATHLSMTSGTYATDLPPFNPLRFFAEESGERYVEPPQEAVDADVSVVKHDLATVLLDANAPALSDDEAAAQIEEERRMTAEAGRRAGPAIPIPPQLMLSRTLTDPTAVAVPDFGLGDPGPNPFKSIDVRVVPENVTTFVKSPARGSGGQFEENDVAFRRGDSMESVLRQAGATPEQIRAIITALGREKVTQPLEGRQFRILTARGTQPGEPRQVVRVILFGERGVEAIAATNDRGAFLSVDPPAEETAAQPAKPAAEDDTEDDESTGVSLYESLYETALKQELPRPAVDELVRMFGYDVDFQRRITPSDSLEIFYSPEEEGGAERAEILYASLTIGGDKRRVYRYQAEDGAVDFFDELGRSLKKFLLRKPIAEGRITSPFGTRFHPILGYSKTHTGVDWANRIGTPILAAGNGTVIKAEWAGGYGRRIEVQHANGYVTTYNHMSSFGRGVSSGTRVRQGQVIGYVGTTGLSTGPHLHYEVVVNGHFVDPMKIRVPRGRELDGRALAEFTRQREQVDQLMLKAPGANRFAETR